MFTTRQAEATMMLGSCVGRFTIKESPEWTVEKRIDHVAYGRNGNAATPTVYYRWEARHDGRLVLSCRTRREACEFIASQAT